MQRTIIYECQISFKSIVSLWFCSGNPVIQRIQRNRRRTTTSLGSLSRMSKPAVTKLDVPDSSKIFDDDKSVYDRFSVNKKSKMINTYGKSRSSFNTKRTSQFTGSLSDRLRLIDTTPTGEDPYQLGEADMREQSPIPKLMLQKTNHGRMKICTETSESANTARRIFNSMSDISSSNNLNLATSHHDRYNLTNPYMHPSEIKTESPPPPKTLMIDEPDLDIVKTEAEIDWRMYNPIKPGNETSLCDFSYGETPSNLASNILPSLDVVDFQDLFSSESLNLGPLTTEEFGISSNPSTLDKSKKRVARTSSLIGPHFIGVSILFLSQIPIAIEIPMDRLKAKFV